MRPWVLRCTVGSRGCPQTRGYGSRGSYSTYCSKPCSAHPWRTLSTTLSTTKTEGAELLKLRDGSPPKPKAATTGPSAARGHYLGRCAPAFHRAQPRQFRNFIFSSPFSLLPPRHTSTQHQLPLPVNICSSLDCSFFLSCRARTMSRSMMAKSLSMLMTSPEPVKV
jgi:hypothetical protein